MDKYEHLTGEDLGYKPGVAEKVKFEYSPLGEALNKGLKKDDKVNKVVKYDSDLMYNSGHDFNKYSVSTFNEISPLYSKLDPLNKFYNNFKTLEDFKSQTNETKLKKITLLKMHQCFMMSWLRFTKKNMVRRLSARIKNGN